MRRKRRAGSGNATPDSYTRRMAATGTSVGATGPVVLVIRDGWGRNPHLEHDAFNAVKLARTP